MECHPFSSRTFAHDLVVSPPTTVGIETTGDDAGIERFIRGLPKTDLHIHLEGSIEPELMLTLADRNRISLPWSSTVALRMAYHFKDLQSFLDLYFAGCRVLVHERDFYDVTLAYLERAVVDGVIRAELFIGPQSFTERGVSISALISGVLA